ncbi:ROK family protein [Bacteroides sp.]|uniref:ROK family protein n=1 Tax=Bacteroides sp. TaxID=29523 RepID=UPI00258CC0EB|nr:ROK family protein [Bacteroides sp.]
MKNLLGIDIGGTKCAVVFGRTGNDEIEIVDKIKFDTTHYSETIEQLFACVDEMMHKHNLTSENTEAIGISCGGPLDNKTGVIMSPPNLPGWDNVHIVDMFSQKLGIKAALENDANACALAEYFWGAGKGSNNMVFLTFGTGLGAGIVLDGRLYSGTNGNAGEVGHIRLSDYGPVGYGKAGSFEGFCSGSGISQLAVMKIKEKLQMGCKTFYNGTLDELHNITAKDVAEAANSGDELAKEILEISACNLGKGLAVIVDILNPEVIVIGSIFTRAEKHLRPVMEKCMNMEALSQSAEICKVKPALLGEHIGDYAALSVALNSIRK